MKGLWKMNLKDLKAELEQDIKTILESDFEVSITDTKSVPSIDTPDITYPNLDEKKLKAKRIRTCVLYIDIRKSTELNLKHKPITLTRLYAAFMRSMVKAAQHYNGRVRNIIGDRVMVLFDEENCFTNAVKTAILLNSVAKYILNKHFSHNEIECGIGIDYGRILVSKGGIKKNGTENAPYKSLVWLGRPANVASKLTDLANKTTEITTTQEIQYLERSAPPYRDRVTDISLKEFFERDFFMNSGWEKRNPTSVTQPSFYCKSPEMIFYYLKNKTESKTKSIITKPILMTKDVYDAYVKANPKADSVKNNWWTKQDNDLYPGYTIYEGDVHYLDIKND